MNIRKLLPVGLFLAPLATFAQSTTPTLDVSSITEMGTTIQTGITTMVTNVMPILIGIGIAVLVIWLAPTMAGSFKTWYLKFKGR